MLTAKSPLHTPPRPIATYRGTTPTQYSEVSNYIDKGEVHPPEFRDPIFALFFLAMLLAILICSVVYTPSFLAANELSYSIHAPTAAFFQIALLQAASCVALVVGSLTLMMAFTEVLIKGCLIGSIGVNVAASIMSFASGFLLGGILWAAFSCLSACYAYYVWDRIPFATANLQTGITAVKSNMGLLAVALISLVFAFGWTFWWLLTYMAISFNYDGGGDGGDGEDEVQLMNGGLVFLLLVCFYWTHQVVANIVHVTVAGTIGTWWFNPPLANSCWSTGVASSFKRASTYSLGSICFGSLLVALIQATRAIVEQMRQSDEGMLVCIADCILGCIQSIAEYFNKWAFVYVGLYGYSYIEAGKNVMNLFKARGWTAIINDDLISNVLMFLSFSIGACTGSIGLLLSFLYPNAFEDDNGGRYIVFFLGLLIGVLFSSIVFSVVISAVDTVVVCFAEAPLDFQTNYPDLHDTMNVAWRAIYPAVWNPEEMSGTNVGGTKRRTGRDRQNTADI